MITLRNAVEEQNNILTREEFFTIMNSFIKRDKFLIRFHGQDKLVYEVVEKYKDVIDITPIKEIVGKVDPYLFAKTCYMSPGDVGKFVIIYGEEVEIPIPTPIKNRMIHIFVG